MTPQAGLHEPQREPAGAPGIGTYFAPHNDARLRQVGLSPNAGSMTKQFRLDIVGRRRLTGSAFTRFGVYRAGVAGPLRCDGWLRRAGGLRVGA